MLAKGIAATLVLLISLLTAEVLSAQPVPDSEYLSLSSIQSAARPASLPQISPPNFTEIPDVSDRKQAFFAFMRPLIKQANEAILKERRWIASLNFEQLTDKQRAKVSELIQKYRLKYTQITPQTQKNLLKKVDVIPQSLALAQAANESSWGTSRFARQANNFFGQWCFTPGCGLVPKQRRAGDSHEVKKFANVLESVKSYMLMLNSHPAFKPLRDVRLAARKQKQSFNGLTLVQGLEPYSALKQTYIESISQIIEHNQLTEYDL